MERIMKHLSNALQDIAESKKNVILLCTIVVITVACTPAGTNRISDDGPPSIDNTGFSGDEYIADADAMFKGLGVIDPEISTILLAINKIESDMNQIQSRDKAILKHKKKISHPDESLIVEKDKLDEQIGNAKKISAFMKYAKNLVSNEATQGMSEDEKIKTFFLAKRILYSAMAIDILYLYDRYKNNDNGKFEKSPFTPPDGASDDASGLKRVLARKSTDIKTKLEILKRQFAATTLFNLELANGDDLVTPAKEARFLIDEDGKPVAAANKTVLQYSRYGVSETHPAWYSEKKIHEITGANWYVEKRNQKATGIAPEKSEVQIRWEHLESWAEEQVRKTHPEFTIAKARRVVFFKKLKTSATSPKIIVKDVYGEKWKLKWGDEIQTEVIANRLSVGLGAKYADLTYVNGPGYGLGIPGKIQPGTILVLPRKNEKRKKKEEALGRCYPVTATEFADCLLKSNYAHNIRPNILESGPIDQSTWNKIKDSFAHSFKDGETPDQVPDKYKDREYVVFKESMFEFQSKKFALRGGPVAFSSVGARSDRIARGVMLMNLWFANRDAKDDNNKGYLLKGFNGKDQVYIEAQHDLGFSFGGRFIAGEFGSLKGEEFIFEKSGRLKFDEPLAYLPKAWLQASMSDLLFFARKILGLSDEGIIWALEQSNWPQFYIDFAKYKIDNRRRGIAKIIMSRAGASNGNFPAIKKLKIFSSELMDDDRIPGEIKLSMLNYLNGYLVKDGVLSVCNKNKGIAFLTEKRYPSGINYRLSRMNDDQEPKSSNPDLFCIKKANIIDAATF